MIGIVLVTHGDIGKEMLAAAKNIIPEANHVTALAIDSTKPPAFLRGQVQKAINQVTQPAGVLLLTDMFGGTPANICLSFLNKGEVEVIAGVNLPMLIKLINQKEEMSLAEMASFINTYGQRNIVIASKVLDGEVK